MALSQAGDLFTLVLLLIVAKAGDAMYLSLKNPEEDRTHLWEQSLKLIDQSPVYGHGIGSFYHLMQDDHLSPDQSYPPYTSEVWAVSDNTAYCFNEYLRIAVDNGISGLLFFVLFLLTALYNAIRTQQAGFTGCILAFMIFAFYSDVFDIRPLSIIFTIILALCGRRLAFLQSRPNKRYAYCSILSQ